MEAFNRRVAVWRDTEANAPPALAPAVKHRHLEFFRRPSTRYGDGPYRVTVEDADAIDLAVRLLAEGRADRPLVLVLADDSMPGGCVYTGSGAQEESIFRRTNLHRSLEMRHYPIRDDEAVYAPDVVVLKCGEAAGFAPLSEGQRCRLAFLACPGLRHPEVADGRLREADVRRLRVKAETVLQVAAQTGHDALVLGAMGCGAWKNPPEHVAEVWRDALLDWRGVFREVAFAVLRGTAAGYVNIGRSREAENHGVFRRVLCPAGEA